MKVKAQHLKTQVETLKTLMTKAGNPQETEESDLRNTELGGRPFLGTGQV